jgi:hypothetical protein
MSYSVADMKWGTPTLGTDSGTILWASDLSSGLNYDSGLYNAGQFDSALQSAFNAWENVASIDFETTGSFGSADITVDMASLAGATVGRATTSFAVLPGTDRILESEIDLDSNVEWSPYGDSFGGLSFYAVALHEIGHAIGMEHVNDTSEIMNPFVEANELGDGDVAGARVLYGSDPGDVGGDPDPDTSPTPALAEGGAADDGGSSSGGFLGLLLAAILALVGALLGPAGAAVGMAVGLSTTARDEEDGWSKDTDDDVAGGAKDPNQIVTNSESESVWMAEWDDIPLSDLVPILEADGIELETHEHLFGGCDGCCGGTCGDPEHLDDALAALA